MGSWTVLKSFKEERFPQSQIVLSVSPMPRRDFAICAWWYPPHSTTPLHNLILSLCFLTIETHVLLLLLFLLKRVLETFDFNSFSRKNTILMTPRAIVRWCCPFWWRELKLLRLWPPGTLSLPLHILVYVLLLVEVLTFCLHSHVMLHRNILEMFSLWMWKTMTASYLICCSLFEMQRQIRGYVFWMWVLMKSFGVCSTIKTMILSSLFRSMRRITSAPWNADQRELSATALPRPLTFLVNFSLTWLVCVLIVWWWWCLVF